MIGFNINKTKERAADFAAFRLEGKTPDEAELETLKTEFQRQGPHIKNWYWHSYKRRVECKDVYREENTRRPDIKGRRFKLRPCGELSWDLVRKFSNEILALRTREAQQQDAEKQIQDRNLELGRGLVSKVGVELARLVDISPDPNPVFTLRLRGDEATISKALKALKDAGIKLPG